MLCSEQSLCGRSHCCSVLLHQGKNLLATPFPRNYLNFLITNARMLVAAYWHTGKPMALKTMDERMGAVMEHSFPDRSIIQIDPHAINRRGGGMHCWTPQHPPDRSR